MASLSLQSSLQLHDSNRIPVLGLGTWLAEEKACALALKHGYRHVDTATLYENEDGVGKALRESGLDRKEVFITTKVWDTDHGREKTLEAFKNSLKRYTSVPARTILLCIMTLKPNSLCLEYVDMYLMHSPEGGKTLETWDTILELQRQGLIRY